MSTATLITCLEGAPALDERFRQLWRQADDRLRRMGGDAPACVQPVGVTPGRRRPTPGTSTPSSA